ncbi:DUF2177 family protein [Candidatus Berkelbacteria bacterium]|nr:DUF2177 family protein [Candidatus Berkelbacteria bacterium]
MTVVKNWLIAFVSLFMMSFIWHSLILNGFYATNLSEIGRYVDGAVAPLLGFLALGNLLVALGFAWFVVDSKADTMSYVKNGLVMALVSTGAFAVLSHAIFAGWNTSLMLADLSYGLISSVLTALILMALNRTA